MRLFAVGDIHGDTRLAERLAERAKKENADLVAMCGDLTYAEQSTENIIGPFVKRGLKVVFIHGNHETAATADFLTKVYGIKNLHGYAIQSGDVGIFGCGGADIGPNPTPDDEILELLKKGHADLKNAKKKIMMTHVHPAQTTMEKFSHFVQGSVSVRKAIELFKPDILLCSHIHEAEGIEEMIGSTKVINVGRKGKMIEL